MRTLFAVLILVSACSIAFSQKGSTRPDYQLLWKIEGHGLKKPSYLFGTMHLYDDRVFDFSDSVLVKLKECESFATETHPDSVIRLVFKWMFENREENKFKQLLNKKEYAEMDSLVQLRSGLTLDKLKSPQLATIMLDKKMGKKNRSVFLDAYLYAAAKGFGKKLLGLERASDHMNSIISPSPRRLKASLLDQLNNAGETAGEKRLDDMITMYTRGNIDEIFTHLKNSLAGDPEYFKKLITDRNYVMVSSIEKEIPQQSTFIAVGVGHLGGPDGIIEILRKKGYQVSCVTPSFTGLAKKFKLEKRPSQWETFRNEKGGYTLDMPDAPITYKIDSLGLNLNATIDFSTLTFYQTAYLFVEPHLRGKSPKGILGNLEEHIRKRNGGDKIDRFKHFQVLGLEGIDFGQVIKGKYYRTQFILRDPFIYMLQAGTGKEAAYSPDAERFFSSIKIENFLKENWIDFTDEQGAFSVQLYGKPKPLINKVKYGSFIQPIYAFMCEDPNQKENYLVRYNDLPPGYVSQNDSSYYKDFAIDVQKRMNGENLRFTDIEVNGFRGKEFTFDVSGGGSMKGRELLRGNRFYLLLASKNSAVTSEANPVFDSFRFTDFKQTPSQEYAINEDLKINLPSPFHYDTALSTDLHKVYYSVDPATGVQLVIQVSKLGPYEHYENEPKFFEKNHKRDKPDTIILRNKIEGKDFFGEEITISSPEVNHLRKLRTLVQGQYVYNFTSFMQADYSKIKSINEFFNSIKLTNKKPEWNIFARKTDQLLKDLTSTDSLVFEPAKTALFSYIFSKDEIQKLYEAIQINYADDTSTYSSVKRTLITKLTTVNDTTTVRFIKDNYRNLPVNMSCRSAALHVLSSLKTEEGTKAFLDVLKSEEKVKFQDYYSISGFADSLRLLEPILPELFQHRNKLEFSSHLYELTASLLKKDSLNRDATEKISQLLLKAANEDIQNHTLLDVKHEDYYYTGRSYEELVNALALVPVKKEVLEVLQKICKVGYSSANVIALPYLAKNNADVQAKDLEKLASDPYYRVRLYESLKEAGREKLFPGAYLQQQKFAESMLWQYMDNEDGTPDELVLLDTKIVEIEKTKQKLFVYKYRYTEGDWYIALSGPFKGKDLTSDGSLTYGTGTVYNKTTFKKDLSKTLDEAGIKLLK